MLNHVRTQNAGFTIRGSKGGSCVTILTGVLLLGFGCARNQQRPVANAMEAWAIGTTVAYKGTFLDEAGHRGPLTCELTRVTSTLWSAAFSAANEGEGPNRPFTRSADLTGSAQGPIVEFSGEVFMKAGGPYVLRAFLSANDTLTAKYARKAGGWAGTFELRRTGSATGPPEGSAPVVN